jgi:hypothetical protein
MRPFRGTSYRLPDAIPGKRERTDPNLLSSLKSLLKMGELGVPYYCVGSIPGHLAVMLRSQKSAKLSTFHSRDNVDWLPGGPVRGRCGAIPVPVLILGQ